MDMDILNPANSGTVLVSNQATSYLKHCSCVKQPLAAMLSPFLVKK